MHIGIVCLQRFGHFLEQRCFSRFRRRDDHSSLPLSHRADEIDHPHCHGRICRLQFIPDIGKDRCQIVKACSLHRKLGIHVIDQCNGFHCIELILFRILPGISRDHITRAQTEPPDHMRSHINIPASGKIVFRTKKTKSFLHDLQDSGHIAGPDCGGRCRPDRFCRSFRLNRSRTCRRCRSRIVFRIGMPPGFDGAVPNLRAMHFRLPAGPAVALAAVRSFRGLLPAAALFGGTFRLLSSRFGRAHFLLFRVLLSAQQGNQFRFPHGGNPPDSLFLGQLPELVQFHFLIFAAHRFPCAGTHVSRVVFSGNGQNTAKRHRTGRLPFHVSFFQFVRVLPAGIVSAPHGTAVQARKRRSAENRID